MSDCRVAGQVSLPTWNKASRMPARYDIVTVTLRIAVLEGIRIIELEGLGPAPFAGMLLADLGAEVVVIHRRGPQGGTAPLCSLLDRGKKSVELDLKSPDDVRVLKRLVGTADGLIEGFRPGVMERLGLGPDALRDCNPRLVYGRVTGWGQDGPKSSLAGHDLNYIALSGALAYASRPGDSPRSPPTLTGDVGGGALYLVAGMLAGLLRAQRTGQGTVVDAAIVDGSAHMLNLLRTAEAAGLFDRASGKNIIDGAPWSRCYRCADGGWLAVQCLEPKFYALFREKLGVDGDAALAQNPDPAAWPSIAARFEELIASKSRAEWSAIFDDSDACAAPVLEPNEAARHPHMAARGTWFERDGQLEARAAPRFDGEKPRDPKRPPRRGEHTAEILASLETG
ncbi:MAG: CaiB/BaiF CoA-transferase family protein [Woeseiaceae bacterium]|nr:CaiB/BaiF CoA-transferase family protein [Woeseiaceae bacterium]